jgi:hypothetical protein
MPVEQAANWTISVFVPNAEPANARPPPDPSVEPHSAFREWLMPSGRIEHPDGELLQKQWADTIDKLLKLTSTVSERLTAWKLDEIEVGLTLSAKGELLFIAEAGAEASVKLTLKRP